MDPNTVIVMLAIHLTCSGGLFHLIGQRLPPRSGVGQWSAGATLFGLAYLGRLWVGTAGDRALSPFIDAAMVLSALLFISGVRLFVGRPALPGALLAVAVLAYVLVDHLVLSAWSLPARYVLLNVSLGAIYAGLAATALWAMRREDPALRMPLLLLGALIGGLAALTGLRGVLIGLNGTAGMYTGFAAQLFYAYASVAAVLLGLNLLWMLFVRLNRQLAELATRDPLTRVLNRNGLDDALARHFGARGAEPVTLLQVDVDHFKQINDGHGHASGDAVLCAVAACLTGRVRGGDFVARVGGEEFLVGCVGRDPGVSSALAERLRHGVGELEVPVAEGRGRVRCTVSVGVSRRFAELAEWQRAWHEADQALYAAKAGGRDRVVRFEVA